jgi:hypothetical protein
MVILLATNSCSNRIIPTAEFEAPFTLELGQTVRLSESAYTITFVQVLQDARCPTQVECETHGPVVVRLAFQHPDENPVYMEMNPDPGLAGPTGGQSVLAISGYEILLISVAPYPDVPEDVSNFEEYEVTLSISDQTGNP